MQNCIVVQCRCRKVGRQTGRLIFEESSGGSGLLLNDRPDSDNTHDHRKGIDTIYPPLGACRALPRASCVRSLNIRSRINKLDAKPLDGSLEISMLSCLITDEAFPAFRERHLRKKNQKFFPLQNFFPGR